MSGLLGDLPPAQAETLEKFKKALSQEQLLHKKDDDYTLLRFLKARGFDLEKAKAMFKSMLEWRREVGADTIKEVFEFPERKATLLLYPRFHHKTDKLGRPVYIERLGQLRVDELLKITTLDRVFMAHVLDWEVLIDLKFPACSEKVGRDVRQSLTILDLKGVTPKHMSKPVRQFIHEIAKVDQDYYPEFLGKMIIINAPVAFMAMWTAVKPWIDKRTKKKIEVYGGNFAAKLLELIEKEDLPEFLGGSCRCVGGCENSDAGPWNVAAESSIDSRVIA